LITKTTKRRAIAAAALVVASAGVFAGNQMASANLSNPGGSPTFEGHDANIAGQAIVANGAYDWQNLATAPSGTNVHGTDAATGQCDNSFTQGSKEDDTNVVIGQGSIPNSKADLGQFAVGSLVPTSGPRAGHTIMALAWVRNNTSGTTNFDFEINQVAQPSMTFASCPLPDRAVQLQRRGDGVVGGVVDDILISYDVQGGAQNPTFSFRRWQQDSQNPALPGYLTGHWSNPTTVAQADSEGSTNTTQAIAPPLNGFSPVPGSTGIPPAQFGEGDLDMTALGIIPNRNDPNAGCVAFGSGYVKSRASSAFTAQMKDYIAPIGLGINTCATIIIDKVTLPAGDPQLFTFTPGAGLPAGTFQLADATAPKQYGNLVPGTYSVAETVPGGWDLTSATCSDGSPVTAIALGANETVTCTFTNTKRGRVIIDKVTAPNPDPTGTVFDFTGSFGPFSLTNAAAPFDSGLVAPGAFNVSETAEPGWTANGSTCNDADSPNAGSINVGPGETVTCTFTNTGYGHIIVHKATDPAGASQAFEFDTNYGDNFSLSDGQSNDSGAIAPGNAYSVDELTPAGWVESSATCSNGSPVTAITVAPGETVDCYFSNTQNAHIVVVKHIVGPNPDDATFGFSADYSATGFGLKDGEQNDSGELAPNTYSAAEVLAPGWKLVNQNTTDGVSGSVVCSDGSDSLNIDLSAGETVVCSFTNERQVGAINIVKTAKSAAAGGSVGVAGVNLVIHDVANNVDIPVTTGVDGTVCVNYFGFGDYTVTEVSAPAGYSIDPNTYPVTLDTVSYCDPETYGDDAVTVNVVDEPLTDVTITVDSLVGGGTNSVINCYDKDGNLLDTLTAEDGSLYIPNIKPTDPLIATLHCDLFIDP